MNFRKSYERKGGGLFSIQKFILQNFDLETGLFKHDFQKKIQLDFQKMRGVVKGCLKLFLKIRFGNVTRPLFRQFLYHAGFCFFQKGVIIQTHPGSLCDTLKEISFLSVSDYL